MADPSLAPLHRQLLTLTAQHAGLPEDEADAVLRTVLAFMGVRLNADDRGLLVKALPPALAEAFASLRPPVRGGLIDALAKKRGLDQPRALQLAVATSRALSESLPPAWIAQLRRGLSRDAAGLIEPVPGTTPLPTRYEHQRVVSGVAPRA